MVRWVVFVALLMSSFACAGCGINWGSASDCIGDPSDPFSCPTPEPTDTPQPEPPQPPDLTGCVPQAVLLFPSSGSVMSSYSGTMYVTVPDGEFPGAFLALVVRQTNPASHVQQGEIGTTLTRVTAAPPYVASPPPGFAGVYSSSNLPLVGTWPTQVLLVDTRAMPQCDTLSVATLNAQSVLRAPRLRSF